jgi:hypothetical protein
MLYLFGTNIRSAYKRWASTPVHLEKIRGSPNVQSNETLSNALTTARRISERPVPLTLPSRKSSQHLNGLMALTPTTTTPRGSRLGSAFGAPEHLTSRGTYSASAPVSPQGSPRMPFLDDPPAYSYREDDVESMISDTPNISRRSSLIYMNGHGQGNGHGYGYEPYAPTPAVAAQEATSYFLPLPNSNGPTGLGFSTPLGSTYPQTSHEDSSNSRRASSSNLQSHHPPIPNRRTTMPRLVSTSDWHAAAKAKEKTVFGMMVDSLPLPGGGIGRNGSRRWEGIRGFVRWLWKARNGVVAKSWREVWAVAWPAGVVWVVINGLFFIG